MSSETFAFNRRRARDELNALAEEHMQHDLQPADRDKLQSSAQKIAIHTTLGSLIGIGLGAYFAFRLRRGRLQLFEAFKAKEKPTAVQFADGRTETLPDITPFFQPSPAGDFATYFLFGAGGLFIGGETGFLTGTYSASRTLSKDPESKARIENAFRKFRADVLRKEADQLDGGQSALEQLF
ncbi:hypothetical protein Plec18167_001022 [Paecilomyces lecythidis]|uniref:Transmembrane protein n=1 Tax=Paecilomyces lecythidis TaxID=3004212 RepID=A0ABR3YBQ1_9EURO